MKISFNKDAVAHMTAEQFIAHFQPTYPDADLQAYAISLGLISEAVAPEAPPAIPPRTFASEEEAKEAGRREGADDAALLKEVLDLGNKDLATSSKTSKPKGGKK